MNVISEFWDGLLMSEKICMAFVIFTSSVMLGLLWRGFKEDFFKKDGS